MTTPQNKLLSAIRMIGTRRQQITAAIQAEERKPLPDSLRLTRLKKMRLAMKDRMFQLRQKLSAGKDRRGLQPA